MPRSLAGALLLLALAACRGNGPSPLEPQLALDVVSPVAARHVSSPQDPVGHLVAEFPIVITDRNGVGGTLGSVETQVFNRTRNTLLARNIRPNASFSYPDVHVPPRGRLTVQAGVSFNHPPPRDEIVVTAIVTLTNGGRAERTVALVLPS